MSKLNRNAVALVAAILIAFGVGILVTYVWLSGSGSDAPPNQGFRPEGLTVSGTVFHVDSDPLVSPTGQYQARALIRMKPIPTVKPGGGTDHDEFEKFKASELVRMRTKAFLSSVAEHYAVAGLPLVARANNKAHAIDQLLGSEWVSPDLFAVLMTGDDPVQLKVILRVFVETYLQKHVEQKREDASQELELAQRSLQQLEDEIVRSRSDAVPVDTRDLLAQKAKLEDERAQAKQKVLSLAIRVELEEAALTYAISDVTSKFKMTLDTRKANGEAVRTTFEVGSGAKFYTSLRVEGSVPLSNAGVEVKLKPWPGDTKQLLEAVEVRVIGTK